MRTTYTVKTSITRDSDEKSTQLTLDWDGVSQEDLMELASRSIIITTQSRYRRAKVVPESDVVKVADIGTRAPAVLTPERMIAAAQNFTAEQRAELLKQLRAMKE